MRKRSEKTSQRKPLGWTLKRGNDGMILPGRADGREERAEQRKASIRKGLQEGRHTGGGR